jgi:hypothetical protein
MEKFHSKIKTLTNFILTTHLGNSIKLNRFKLVKFLVHPISSVKINNINTNFIKP